MSSPAHDFAEGQHVFIITKAAMPEPCILFASSIDAILPVEDGDLILADGLRFRRGADGVFTTRSGNRMLTLMAKTDDTIARAKAHGTALREARRARKTEAAHRAEKIRAATDAVGVAQHGLSYLRQQKSWRDMDLISARAKYEAAQRKVDDYPTELAQRQEKLRLAEEALEAVRARNS